MKWIKYILTVSEGQESNGGETEFTGERSIINALKFELMVKLF